MSWLLILISREPADPRLMKRSVWHKDASRSPWTPTWLQTTAKSQEVCMLLCTWSSRSTCSAQKNHRQKEITPRKRGKCQEQFKTTKHFRVVTGSILSAKIILCIAQNQPLGDFMHKWGKDDVMAVHLKPIASWWLHKIPVQKKFISYIDVKRWSWRKATGDDDDDSCNRCLSFFPFICITLNKSNMITTAKESFVISRAYLSLTLER